MRLGDLGIEYGIEEWICEREQEEMQSKLEGGRSEGEDAGGTEGRSKKAQRGMVEGHIIKLWNRKGKWVSFA